MQAVVFHEHGGPEVLRLEEMPTPTPGPGEVLMQVRACSVMRTLDCEVRRRAGAYGPIPMPHISGVDPAGVVAGLGPGVNDLAPGERVVSIGTLWCGACRMCARGLNNGCLRGRIQGVHTQGGYAEYVVTPASNIVRLPEGLSFEEASGMMTITPVAWHLLIDRAGLRAGETVLILAAGGALGTAGIQVAKLAGARVIAAAGADWKLDKARELGADEVINYRTARLSEEVKRHTDGWGADVVFENLSVPELWSESLASAAQYGRVVTCGALGGGSVETNVRAFYLRQLSLIGSRGAPPSQVADVYRRAGENQLRPIIYRTFPLAEVAEAQALVESRDVFGRVVVQVS